MYLHIFCHSFLKLRHLKISMFYVSCFIRRPLGDKTRSMRSLKFRITSGQMTGIILFISCLIANFKSFRVSEADWYTRSFR